MAAKDWPLYWQFMMSNRAYYIGGPFSFETAWGMFCADHAQWDLFGCGALMIEEHATGTCVGQIGINFGPLFPEHELGWLLYPQAEGRGYGYEAALTLRHWAQHERRLESLVSYIHPQNSRSCGLAIRLGAVQDDNAARPDPSDLVFRHFGKPPVCDR